MNTKKILALVIALAMVLSVCPIFSSAAALTYDEAMAYASDTTMVFDGRYATTGSTNDTAISSVPGWSNWSSSTANNGYINSRTYTLDTSRNVIQFYKSSGAGGSNSGKATMTASAAYGEGKDVLIMEWYPRMQDNNYGVDNYCYYTFTDASGNAFVNNICIDRNTNVSVSADAPFGRASTAGEIFRIVVVNDTDSATVYYYNSTAGEVTYTAELGYRVNGLKQIDITIGGWMPAWRHQGMGDFCIYACDAGGISEIDEIAHSFVLDGDCNEDLATLPVTVDGYTGSTVTWVSDTDNVVVDNTTGAVTYTKTDAVQTAALTATIEYNGDSAEKTFNITVHANAAVPAIGERFTASSGIVYEVSDTANLIDQDSFDYTGQNGASWIGRTGVAATDNAAWKQVEGFSDCYAWQSNTSAGSGAEASMNPIIPLPTYSDGAVYLLTFAAKSGANGIIEWSNVQLMDSSRTAIGASLGQINAPEAWGINSYVVEPTADSVYVSPAAGWVGSCALDDFSLVELTPVEVAITEVYVDGDGNEIGTNSATAYLGSTYTPAAPDSIDFDSNTYHRAGNADAVALTVANCPGDAITLTYDYTAAAVEIASIAAPAASAAVIEGNAPIIGTTAVGTLTTGYTENVTLTWDLTAGVDNGDGTVTYTATSAVGAHDLAATAELPSVTVTVYDCDEVIPDIAYANQGTQEYKLANNYVGEIWSEFDITVDAYGDSWVIYKADISDDFFGSSATRLGITDDGYFKTIVGTNAEGAYASNTSLTSSVKAELGATYRILAHSVIDASTGYYEMWATAPDGTTTQLTQDGGNPFRRTSANLGQVYVAASRGNGRINVANHKIYWASGYATVTTETYLDDALYSSVDKKVVPGASYDSGAEAAFTEGGVIYSLDTANSITSTDAAADGDVLYIMYYSVSITDVADVADVNVPEGSDPVLPGTVTVTFSDNTTSEEAVTWSYDNTGKVAGDTYVATGSVAGTDLTSTANVKVWMNASDAAATNGSAVFGNYIIEPTNLWVNGSVEDGLDGFYNVTGANGTGLQALPDNWYRADDMATDGAYSLATTAGGGGTSVGSVAGFAYLNGGKATKAGDKYLLVYDWYSTSGGMTSTNGLGNSASQAFVDETCGGTGNTGSSAVTCNLSGYTANAWNTLSFLLTATDETTVAIVYNRWLSTGDRFDNFRLYKVIGVVEGESDCYNLVTAGIAAPFEVSSDVYALPIGSTLTYYGAPHLYNAFGIAYAAKSGDNNITVSDTDYNVDSTSAVYGFINGVEFNLDAEGDASNVDGYITAYNGTGSDVTYYVIATSYDADGKVVAIDYEAVVLADMSGATAYADVNYDYAPSFTPADGAASVKVYLWDGFENITPLAENVTTY